MKIDYLHGRRAEAVTTNGESWEWNIYLEGGAVIRNLDQRRTSPPVEIVGTAFLASSVDEESGNCNLQFGVVQNTVPAVVTSEQWVAMTWSKMRLSLPGLDEIDPSAVEEAENTLPPDPSSERVVDGPEQP